MQTREDFYAIEGRIDLREQMFYITYPYTSLRQDALLMGADVAKASQEYNAQEEAQRAKTERLSPHAQSPTQVKLHMEAKSGYGAEYTPPRQEQSAVPERATGQIVVQQS